MNHLIHRQELQIDLPGERSPFAVQSRLRDWFHEQLFPIIEKTCDKVSTKEELILIDRLEVDLGRLTPQQLTSNSFLLDFQQQLETAFRDVLSGHTSGQVEKEPVSMHRFGQWLFFLRTGVLPWQTRSGEAIDIKAVLAVLQSSKSAQKQLGRLAIEKPVVVQRLVYQYPGREWEELLTLVGGTNYVGLIEQIEQLSIALEDVVENNKHQNSGAERLLAFRQAITQRILIRPGAGITTSSLLVHLLQEELLPDEQRKLAKVFTQKQTKLSPKWQAAYVTVRQNDRNWGEVSADIQPTPTDSTKATEASSPPSTDQSISTSEHTVQATAEHTASKKTLAERANPKEASPPLPAQADAQMDREATEQQELPSELYVAQAGVVLLHPFLSRYFDRIGLVENGAFKDTNAQNRAALLLHWLAAGQTDSPEAELTIHKYLCGIPLNYPLPRQWTITTEEEKEAEQLLQAVITHWGALGKVSNASLREGFLLRPGKLSQRGGRWLLQPEQKTIDILLGKLPWSISIIKLPWMPEMLTVEWA